MLLVTEYDSALQIKEKLPPSVVREIYLVSGVVPQLNNTPTLFGTPIHIVYLGYNLRPAEQFITSLKGNTSNVILVAPLSRWGLYGVKFKTVADLQISNQFDTQESKVELVQKLTGLNKKKTTQALSILKYNFGMIEKNLDLLRWCGTTNSDIETALASVEYYSYSDVLFYLCGSKKHTKEKFMRTLSRYRYGKKQIFKYLKDTLDDFIDYKLDGIEPPKDMKHTIDKLSMFLYLEDALRLRYTLDHAKDLSDLLKGEV